MSYKPIHTSPYYLLILVYFHLVRPVVSEIESSGNIYYANYDGGYVRKVKYDGTEIAVLALTNPYMVSVIQNSTAMNSVVTDPPQDDQGCYDRGSGQHAEHRRTCL